MSRNTIEGFSFVCKYCKAIFESMQLLISHKNILHKSKNKESQKTNAKVEDDNSSESSLLYECGICLNTFKDKYKFLIHKDNHNHSTKRNGNIFHMTDGSICSLKTLPQDNIEAFIPQILLKRIEDELTQSLKVVSSPQPQRSVESDQLKEESVHENNGSGTTSILRNLLQNRKIITMYAQPQTSKPDSSSDSSNSSDPEDFEGTIQTRKPKKRSIPPGQVNAEKQAKKQAKTNFCYICETRRSFDNHTTLGHHLKSHSINEKYKCAQCPYICNQARRLNAHMLRHIIAKETSKNSSDMNFSIQLICWYCEYANNPSPNYTNVNTYSVHMKTHLNSDKLYVCPFCPHIILKTTGGINKHFKARHPEFTSKQKVIRRQRTLLCRVCNPSIQFPHQSVYITHMKSHQNSNGTYQCPHCENLTIISTRKLTEHMKLYHTLKETKRRTKEVDVVNYRCNLCIPPKMFYFSNIQFIEHMKEFHWKNNTFECPVCLVKEKLAYVIRTHMEENHEADIPKYVCYFCFPPLPWLHKDLFYAHVKESHANVDGKYNCPLCTDYSRADFTLCTSHIKKHKEYRNTPTTTPPSWVNAIIKTARKKWTERTTQLQNNSRIPVLPYKNQSLLLDFKCNFCTEVHGVSEQALQHHIQAVHPKKLENTEQLSLLCIQCGYIANTTEDLGSHIKSTHVYLVRQKFPCPSCHSRMSSYAKLKIHQRKYHPSGGSSKCHHCDLKFESRKDLISHSFKTHRVHKCKSCKKVFLNVASLRQHNLSSCKLISEKRFMCNICEKTYSTKNALQRHVRSVHKGIWTPADKDIIENSNDSKDSLNPLVKSEHEIIIP